MSRILTYGPKNGNCNICGEDGALTYDHTPPKGCYRPKQVEMQHITQTFQSFTGRMPKTPMQDGVKYRTLCARCNNDLLGSKYDPAFIAFVNGVSAFLTSGLHLPPIQHLRGLPQPIIRSLLGHLAAQGVGRSLGGPQVGQIREYFLDQTAPLPDGIRIFYWVHPYRRHIMIRDAVLSNIKHKKHNYFWLLKFFPIAFLVLFGEDVDNLNYSMDSLSDWGSLPFDKAVEIPIRLSPIIHQEWPEKPTENTFLLYGQEAVIVNLNPSPKKWRRDHPR